MGTWQNINYHSLGTILKIVPFNFPIWTGLKFLVPNLLVGNTVVLWLSENCLLVSEILEKII